MHDSAREFLNELRKERDSKQAQYDGLIALYQKAIDMSDGDAAGMYEHQARVLINDIRQIDTTIDFIEGRIGA